MEEFNSVRNLVNSFNSLRYGFRIPPREKSFSVLSGAKMRRSRRNNALTLCTIKNERTESPFKYIGRIGKPYFHNSIVGRVKVHDHPLHRRAMTQDCIPEISNIHVQICHNAALDKILHNSSKRDDGTTAKRFEQNPRFRFNQGKPHPNMRDQPRLSARITQGTALGNRGNICSQDGRNLKNSTHCEFPCR